jgi:hypothetical protein
MLKLKKSFKKEKGGNAVKEMYLQPIFSDKMSFYKKAKVVFDNGKTTLYSYDTKIIELKGRELVYMCEDYLLSQTTLRHLKEFLKQFYKNKEYTKKEILKELKL